MTETPINIAELRKQFPFPWGYQQFANGSVRVHDAIGREIPIPTMVGFLVTLTTIMFNQEHKA